MWLVFEVNNFRADLVIFFKRNDHKASDRMEHNEITVRVDVKMDLKERRSEFAVYRVRRRQICAPTMHRMMLTTLATLLALDTHHAAHRGDQMLPLLRQGHVRP